MTFPESIKTVLRKMTDRSNAAIENPFPEDDGQMQADAESALLWVENWQNTEEIQRKQGLVLVPDYRGYARLGTGQYCINHTRKDAEPELVISIATEEEKAGRVVGEDRDNPDGKMIQPEDMAVRIAFTSVAGLDALEKQLRYLREVHFPGTLDDGRDYGLHEAVATLERLGYTYCGGEYWKPPVATSGLAVGEVVNFDDYGFAVVDVYDAPNSPLGIGTVLYTAPQPTPAEIQDAKRWRILMDGILEDKHDELFYAISRGFTEAEINAAADEAIAKKAAS